MKKIWIFIFISIVAIIIVSAIYFFNTSNNKFNNSSIAKSNTSGQKTSAKINEEEVENRIANIVENQDEILSKKETEISAFSTPILDDTPGRLTNISITCSTLNGYIIKAGETFSFNEVIGKPSAERGYQEAKIIVDHQAELGIGGGNCQVSSTLYNAVMAVSGLTITERHEHGKNVYYVEDGKDATVSYGSLDFKFRNDLEKDIKIEAITDNEDIIIKLFQIG